MAKTSIIEKIIFSVILAFLFLNLKLISKENKTNKKDCLCPKSFDKALIYSKGNVNIIVCVNIQEKVSENRFFLTSSYIYNCLSNKIIYDNRFDEVENLFLEIKNEKLYINKTQLLIDSNWNFKYTPICYQTINVLNKKVKVSNFKYLKSNYCLSNNQIDSVSKIISKFDDLTKTKKVVFPYDESVLYLIYSSAYSGNKKSQKYLKNLYKYFILDGGILETYKEFIMTW